MQSLPQIKYKLPRVTLFMGLLLSICIIFLQVGFTYYLSFQALALVLLLVVIIQNKPLVVNQVPMLISFAIFAAFLALTTINVPTAVSQNSKNIFITYIGVVGYAIMIFSAPNIAFRSSENILYYFRYVSLVTLVIIVGLICVTDLSLIPFLSRETLILQNTTLIDNFATLDILLEDISARSRLGAKLDMDLFYGEQSFLSVVIFSCLTSYIICDSILMKIDPTRHAQALYLQQSKSFSFSNYNTRSYVIIVALASIIYIQSFSSFFYALVIGVSLFLSDGHRFVHMKLTAKKLFFISLAVILLGWVVWSVFDYYFLRVSTLSESISLEQRFASIFDFGILESAIRVTYLGMVFRMVYYTLLVSRGLEVYVLLHSFSTVSTF